MKVQKPFSAFFVDDALVHAKENPITCQPGDNLKAVVQLMGDKQIWDLPVVDQENHLVGLLHLHPAAKKTYKLEECYLTRLSIFSFFSLLLCFIGL